MAHAIRLIDPSSLVLVGSFFLPVRGSCEQARNQKRPAVSARQHKDPVWRKMRARLVVPGATFGANMNGRNDAVRQEEEDFRERNAKSIANIAAERVAAGDDTRSDAIKGAADYLRRSREADADITGTLEVELEAPKPSRKVSAAQVQKIAEELMDAARDAADTL